MAIAFALAFFAGSVITRALENQVYFFSLNRAGEAHGSSIYCPPWIDYETKPFVYGKKEELFVFEPQRAMLETVRKEYPFRMDHLGDYAKRHIASGE